MIELHDIEIGKYILSILQTQPTIVASWGLDPSTLRNIKYGIEFHVQGFKHTGMVQVTLNEGEDLFEVALISESGETKERHESIFLDNLISVVDNAVEKVENYEKRVSEEYPFFKDNENPEKVKPIEIVLL